MEGFRCQDLNKTSIPNEVIEQWVNFQSDFEYNPIDKIDELQYKDVTLKEVDKLLLGDYAMLLRAPSTEEMFSFGDLSVTYIPKIRLSAITQVQASGDTELQVQYTDNICERYQFKSDFGVWRAISRITQAYPQAIRAREEDILDL